MCCVYLSFLSFYCYGCFFLMVRRPPRSTRTDTLFPYTTLFRSVELRPHRTAIGAEHADLDEVAGLDVRRQIEGPRHMVEVVAGRPVEAERRQLLARRFAQQRDRKAPADMRRVEQRAIGAVVDIKIGRAHVCTQSLMRNSYA